MDMDLAATAATHGGAFRQRDTLATGMSRRGVARRVEAGLWRRLTQGVYVEQARWDAMDANARHLCEVHAALLTRDPAWHAGRRSAAIGHGLPLLGKPPPVPQLVRDPLRPTDRSSSRHHRLASLPQAETSVRRNLRVTSLARTVVDIAREESLASAVVVADAALRQGVTLDELNAVAVRCATWPGARRVAPVLELADGLSESALESLSRVSMHLAGLPAPELQVEVWVGQRFLARLDFLWRDGNLVGEADGRVKYETAADVYAEKRRQETLEDVGLVFARWGWQVAHDRQGELTSAVRRGLARGQGRRLDPGVRFVTTTVEDAQRRDAWFDAQAA